jgi:Mn2+/Fe2+ NRAMP family transporter
VKGLLGVALGVVTSIGGFVEAGSISTAVQAGAEFRFALLWAIAIAALCAAALVEMTGRLAAVSGHTLVDAIRERFGIHFQLVPLTGELLLDLLLLTAEIGAAAVALTLLTNLGLAWWVAPIGFVVWLLLWLGSFGVIENGLGLLGLLTLVFVVAVFRLRPAAAPVLAGFVPSLPPGDWVRYGYLAVSIVGATISPYLLNFYSSGAVEERWSKSELGSNRLTAFLGMGFGSLVSMAVLVVGAVELAPRGIRVDSYEQAALSLQGAFGRAGVPLFAAALFIGCFGAAVEIALNLGYVIAQTLGWTWGENKRPRDDARFSLTTSLVVVLAVLIAFLGVDPLSLTMVSMAFTVLVMPFVILPMLVIMNDPTYLGRYRNHAIGNALVVTVIVLAALLALVVIPLSLMAG